MGEKVNRMPFFFNLPWKNNCSHTLILSTKGPFSKKYGKFAQNTKLAEYYSVNWTKMSEIFSKHLKIKEISEIMSEICSKYRKSVDIMVQIWEEFFFKDQNCTAIIYLLDKNAKNFCSIGFKGPILVIVDLIFFWQKRFIFYSDFMAKNKKHLYLMGLMVF